MDSSRLTGLRTQQFLFATATATAQQTPVGFNSDILRYLSSGTTLVANGSRGIFGSESFRFNSDAGSNGIVYIDGSLIVGGDNAIVRRELISTYNGLSTFVNFVVTDEIISSITGLGSAGYLSSINGLTSTVAGLGSAGYLSSIVILTSTVTGLGTAGYLSSIEILTSTVTGLGMAGYVSSFNSTINGLGTAGYLSSFETTISTVGGLGTAGYLSSFETTISTVTGLGSAGYLSTSSGLTISPRLGNVLTVDKVNGNDSIASPGGYPYATINVAVSNLVNGDTLWILPGIYSLTSPIDLSSYNNIAIRGMNVQTVNIIMCNVVSDTTLITLSENSRIEDLSLKLHSTSNVNLVGLQFPGTTGITSKIITCDISIDNSNVSYLDSNNVYCVEFSGSGSLDSASFSFNTLKGSTFNVYANGEGRKRGLYLSSGNSVTVRDINIFVASPSDTRSTGSYIGIETNHPDAEIQCRTTSIGAIPQTGSFSASDILQTRGLIQLGPGTDLINKTAGQSTFTSYVAPTTILYGVKGYLNNTSILPAYLWPGSLMVTPQLFGDTPVYPDNSIGYFRISQKSILMGMSAILNTGPSEDFTTTITVLKNNIPTYFNITFDSNDTYPSLKTLIDNSINLGIADYISVQLDFTGAASNTSHDLMVQLELY